MSENRNNIVLFPKVKSILKQESLDAITEGRYEEALTKINILLDHETETHDILVGKLICFMELGYHMEAEELCEELIQKNDEHFYDYFHIYTNLLFQTSQYDILIEKIEQLFQTHKVPTMDYNQLNQLYEISKKLYDDKKQEDGANCFNKLKKAVEQQNITLQWNIIEKLKELEIAPYLNYLIELLHDRTINPVVKTAIINWMQLEDVNQTIQLEKFDRYKTINPAQLQVLGKDNFSSKVLNFLDDVEQHNPSLFELIKKLLYRFIYVNYPFLPSEQDTVPVATVLTILGNHYLQLEHNELLNSEIDPQKLESYMSQIIESEKQYLTIIDD